MLLAGCLAGAATFDPASWPSLAGDEATYLMAAESLAFDFDLRYEIEDHERLRELVESRGGGPESLIVQSTDGGATLRYSKPPHYPLAVAPWVRFAGHRGAVVFNALLLVVVLLATAWALRSWIGWRAPCYVLVAAFVGVLPLQVLWLHSDLLLLACVALAYAPLVRAASGRRDSATSLFADATAGALLAVVITARPFYLPLLLPLLPLLAPPAGGGRWRLRALALGLGLLFTALAVVGLQQALLGSWSSYAAPRITVGSADPLPDAAAWTAQIEARGSNSWTGTQSLPFGFDLAETRWNVLYLFLGRHVGLFPYFAGALLLGLLAMRGDRVGWCLAAAFVVVAAAFLVVRPFNFWGGGGALANRYLLPALPALWFMARRPIHPAWLLAIAAVAAPFLWPAWTQPRSFLLTEQGTYRFASPLAARLLPYETTQSHLKPSGGEDFVLAGDGGDGGDDLWAKPLSRAVRPRRQGDANSPVDSLVIDPTVGVARLLVASPRPIAGFSLAASGGSGRRVSVRNGGVRARHRMWWSAERLSLYELDLGAALAELDDPSAREFELSWRLARR